PREVGVAGAFCDLVALPEVTLRGLELLAVRTHHPKVVIGDGAAVLVVRSAGGLERPPVPRERFVKVTLDVREDAEVLLDARPQLPALPAQLQGAEEVLPGIRDRVRPQADPAHRVVALAREHAV